MRSTAMASAPACSSAAVACSATRPNSPPPERTETEAQTSLPRAAAPGLVGDVERDRPVRGQRQAPVGGLVDLDIEADAVADQLTGHPHARAGREPLAGRAVEIERHRRPFPA